MISTRRGTCRCCGLVFLLSSSLRSACFVCTRGRGLTFTFARIRVRAPIEGPSYPPTDAEGTTTEDDTVFVFTVKSPCSHAHFGCVTPACVSPPRDWAVLTGSHMQQDCRKLQKEKLEIMLPQRALCSLRIPTCVLRSARQTVTGILVFTNTRFQSYLTS